MAITPSAQLDRSVDEALEWIRREGFDACELDDRSELQAALAVLPAATRDTEPLCLAVRAMLLRNDGDIDGAIRLFKRALRMQSLDSYVRSILLQNYAVIAAMRRDFVLAEDMIHEVIVLSPTDPEALALRVIMRSLRRDSNTLDDVEAIETAALEASVAARCRTYSRLAYAFSNMTDTARAMEYSRRIAELGASHNMHRFAALGYWTIASLYSNDIGDVALTYHYQGLCSEAAEIAGDRTILQVSLALKCSIAAEAGHWDIARECLQRAERAQIERLSEKLPIHFSQAMVYASESRFTVMRRYLLAVRSDRGFAAHGVFVLGLSAVAAWGAGERDESMQLVYRTLAQSKIRAREPAFQARLRFLARMMVCSVLVRAGRKNEAARALRAFHDTMPLPIKHLAEAVEADDFDRIREQAPEVYGLAAVLDRLRRSDEAQQGRTSTRLTGRELQVLRLSADGATCPETAAELGIDVATVAWHRKNIMRKLGVTRMIAAVALYGEKQQARS